MKVDSGASGGNGLSQEETKERRTTESRAIGREAACRDVRDRRYKPPTNPPAACICDSSRPGCRRALHADQSHGCHCPIPTSVGPPFLRFLL